MEIDVILSLVDLEVKTYLSLNPSHEFLRDEMVSEGCLSAVQAMKSDEWEHELVENSEGYVRTWIRRGVQNTFDKIQGVKNDREARRDREVGVEPAEYESLVRDGQIEAKEPVDSSFETMDLILSCCQDDKDEKIVDLRAKGFSDTEIAELCELSVRNVFDRRKRLYGRFNRKMTKIQSDG